MNLLKKLFNPKKEDIVIDNFNPGINVENLSVDDIFVHNFIKKGGKFLYCTSLEDINENLKYIFDENDWDNILCFDKRLNRFLSVLNKNSSSRIIKSQPFLTTCEHLISDNGSVMFSSNQVLQHKICDLPNHFIVIAKTSQMVRTTSEALMGIRKNYKKKLSYKYQLCKELYAQ